MIGGPQRGPTASAYQRFAVALGLLQATGFDPAAPTRVPRDLIAGPARLRHLDPAILDD